MIDGERKGRLDKGEFILTAATARAYGHARNYIRARYGEDAVEKYDRLRARDDVACETFLGLADELDRPGLRNTAEERALASRIAARIRELVAEVRS